MLKPSQDNCQNEFFRNQFDNIIDITNPLCILSKKINWSELETHFLNIIE